MIKVCPKLLCVPIWYFVVIPEKQCLKRIPDLVANSTLYVDKGGYSSNDKIVLAELLVLLAQYALLYKSEKSNCNWNFRYGLYNHIKTTKFIFVRSSPHPTIFKKIVVRSNPDPTKTAFSPDLVRSSPDPCSSLVNSKQAEYRLPSTNHIRIVVSLS